MDATIPANANAAPITSAPAVAVNRARIRRGPRGDVVTWASLGPTVRRWPGGSADRELASLRLGAGGVGLL
jgi:hypothetical protein